MVILVQKAFGCEVSKTLKRIRINYEKLTWNVTSTEKTLIAPYIFPNLETISGFGIPPPKIIDMASNGHHL